MLTNSIARGRVLFSLSLCGLMLVGSACQPGGQSEPAAMTMEHHADHYQPADQLDDLFVAVQMEEVFSDSKTFVDSQPKKPPSVIVEKYHSARERPDFDLAEFVGQYFTIPAAREADFQPHPQLTMEEHLHRHWSYLTREADTEESSSSLIPLPNPYVVPGGRFREIYYWDSYFTMHGLAASGREELVENMLNNFAWLAEKIGHIPNGNRTYYLSRSQPPFFAAMVSLWRDLKGSEAAAEYLPQLEQEHRFWMSGAEGLEPGQARRRAVRMADGSLLNRHYDNRNSPRPESFREDVATGQAAAPTPEREIYRELRAAAESGWDFSSRWFDDGATLATIETTRKVPIDLNSLLYHLEWLIADLASETGDTDKADRFFAQAQARRSAINQWLWNTESGTFGDYDLDDKRHSSSVSLAMVYPLYFKIASARQADSVAQWLEEEFLMPGGLVTTLEATGEQWDYPNGWAPLQWLAVQGLNHYGHKPLADEVGQRWLALNRKVFEESGRMMEKYNVVDIDLPAGGGEYPLQDGFGWTNGVALAIAAQRHTPASTLETEVDTVEDTLGFEVD